MKPDDIQVIGPKGYTLYKNLRQRAKAKAEETKGQPEIFYRRLTIKNMLDELYEMDDDLFNELTDNRIVVKMGEPETIEPEPDDRSEIERYIDRIAKISEKSLVEIKLVKSEDAIVPMNNPGGYTIQMGSTKISSLEKKYTVAVNYCSFKNLDALHPALNLLENWINVNKVDLKK